MQEIQITSSHTWNTAVKLTLVVEDGEVKARTWYKNGTRKEYTNTVADFIDELSKLWMFFGVIDNIIIDDERFSKKLSDGFLNVYRLVYQMKLDDRFTFIETRSCFCNMGYCGAITGIDTCKLNTFGDFVAKYGSEPIRSQISRFGLSFPENYPDNYLEYPDSVHLCMEPVSSNSISVYENGCDNNPTLTTLEHGERYISAGYYR